MEELILWMLNQINLGVSNDAIMAKLQMLLAVVRVVPSYTVEDIVKKMLEETADDE